MLCRCLAVSGALGREVAVELSEKERSAARRLAGNYPMGHILPRLLVFLNSHGQSDELQKVIVRYGCTLLTFEKNLGAVEEIWNELKSTYQTDKFWRKYLKDLKLSEDLCD